MELCEILHEGRFSSNVLSRAAKVLVVLLVLCAVASNAGFRDPAAVRRADTGISAPALPAEDPADHAGFEEVIFETADPVMPPAEKEAADPIISAAEEISDPGEAAAVSAIPISPDPEGGHAAELIVSGASEVMPVVPEAQTPEISVQDTVGNAAPAPEDSVTSRPEEPAAQGPAAAVPPEIMTPEPSADVIDGFLVNDSGIICGISDPDLAVNDGYMELPSSGCTGIATGTFSGGLPSVREIFIPANITYIEEGAFSGLSAMEWFEMESSGAYYTEEGVLFSENGKCLLAFPAGRTGNYKVPSQVVRLAPGAFDSAKIEALDATACTLADVSDIPENIRLILRETL